MKLIRLLVTDDRCDAFHGDIQEEYPRRIVAVGERRAMLWYWKEVLLMAGLLTWRWLLVAAAAGAISGASAYYIGRFTTSGRLAAIPYALIILFPIAVFRVRPGQTFLLRFLTSLVAFMTMTVVHYLAIYNFDPHVGTIGLWGHTWRVGFMLAIGSVASASAAFMSRERPRSPYMVAFALALLGFGAMWLVSSQLSAAVLATVLLATAGYLRNQRVQPFARRFTIVLAVNAVMAGLVCLFLVAVVNPPWAGRRFWELLFQHGALDMEIILVGLAIATLTNTRDQQPDPEPQNGGPDDEAAAVG